MLNSSCDCLSRPLSLSRDLSLNSFALRVLYDVKNRSAHDVDFAPLGTRSCGLYRTTQQAGLIFRSFPGIPSRYTGLWLCYGGWPEDAVGTSAAQYAVAIEPTTSPCDSLDEAVRQGTALRVGALSSEYFGMQIMLLYGPLDRFIEFCNQES